jgi:hypothetical protein
VRPPHCRLARGVATPLAPLCRAEDGGAARHATRVTLLDDGERLHARFDCDDPEPWATLREPDADLWTEEVVELFVAAGHDSPARYFELELNPLGTRFDARVHAPHGDRRDLVVDRSWRCAGLESTVTTLAHGWLGELVVPWQALAPGGRAIRRWRLNLYRIDRPRGAPAEHSAWSPTLATPADFHRPARFGFLVRVG